MSSVHYIQRCLDLARLGAGLVAPNPMVGAVLVHEDRIIGEGWHQQYGKAHAEVNCLASVKEEDRKLITQSALYVSLEPCVHFGKTPPCTDLIIQHKIPKVVVGCRDPFKEVDGKGIEKLKAAGVEVVMSDAQTEHECKKLNKRFFTFHTQQRPYIILKWAQTANGKISSENNERLLISNEYTNRLAHQWRSEEAAILVGTNTALLDNPELTTRLWPGPSPTRLVIDMNLRLPGSLKVFSGEVKTVVFNSVKQEESRNLIYYKLDKDKDIVAQLIRALYQLKIQSVLVEGGVKLLQSFIDTGIWDEVRVISNMQLTSGNGLAAPLLPVAVKAGEQILSADKIEIYEPGMLINNK
ncbi:MAG: bifunctional diaminohydroxyphosphoribosylaminopyrimidine deaminase/5-amino-6-(5-phosphoribosylamino)uracil reductase RibD [Chitinophagaceae bacterium]